MKIRLYNPAVFHYSGVHYRMNPTLGLPILVAVLDKAGHDVTVTDLEAMKITPTQLGTLYNNNRGVWPDAVGFTVTTHNARGAKESIGALRGAGFRGFIAVGGPEVTINPDWKDSGADLAVTGECEGNVSELFEQHYTGIFPGKSLSIEDIPSPLWSKHMPSPTSYYGNLPKVGHPEGIAMWSRGCPHNCIFCGNPVFGHQKIRMRPPGMVYQDMAALKGLGVQSVFVYDDELIGMGGKQNPWLVEVCRDIAPLGLTWKCQGRVSQKHVTKDTLQAMYDAGCRAIMWGIESFSNKVLKSIRKGITESDIWHTLEIAREVGIGNWVFLMVGNYQESATELTYTESRFAEAIGRGLVQWRQVTVCTPVRGTKLWELAESEGWLKPSPETGPQMAQVYNSTPWLSEREIRHWRLRLMSA